MRTASAEIEVTPSVKGLPTVHDKDVLIFCVSQLMAAVNAGRPTSPVLHLKAHDLLTATNRETSGDGYRRLREALERLSGTRIVTNIATGGVESTRGFGLIDAWEILRRARGGRMILVTVTLSDWIYRSVLSKSVLTLSRDYFRLRKPLERRVYEIARKHCGRQTEWKVGPRDAPEEVRLDQPAPGVPQDDPRHGRGGRAARLQPRPRGGRPRGGARPRPDARRGAGRPRTRASARRRTPGRARSRPATTPTGSKPNGWGSGATAAVPSCATRRRPSSPSPAPAPFARRSAERRAPRAAFPCSAAADYAVFRARNIARVRPLTKLRRRASGAGQAAIP